MKQKNEILQEFDCAAEGQARWRVMLEVLLDTRYIMSKIYNIFTADIERALHSQDEKVDCQFDKKGK